MMDKNGTVSPFLSMTATVSPLESSSFWKTASLRPSAMLTSPMHHAIRVNGPATYALTGVEVGACQKPQLADFVPAAYWLSG